MKKFDLIFLKKLMDIYKGWKIWHECMKKNNITDDTAFVLMPSMDAGINKYAMLYLDQYLAANQMQTAVLILTEKNKKKIKISMSRKVSAVQVISRKQMQYILAYYCACNPDRRFIVVDLDCFPVRKNLEI